MQVPQKTSKVAKSALSRRRARQIAARNLVVIARGVVVVCLNVQGGLVLEEAQPITFQLELHSHSGSLRMICRTSMGPRRAHSYSRRRCCHMCPVGTITIATYGVSNVVTPGIYHCGSSLMRGSDSESELGSLSLAILLGDGVSQTLPFCP